MGMCPFRDKAIVLLALKAKRGWSKGTTPTVSAVTSIVPALMSSRWANAYYASRLEPLSGALQHRQERMHDTAGPTVSPCCTKLE